MGLPGVVYVVVAAVAPHGQVAEAQGEHVLLLRGVAQAVARHIPGEIDRWTCFLPDRLITQENTTRYGLEISRQSHAVWHLGVTP